MQLVAPVEKGEATIRHHAAEGGLRTTASLVCHQDSLFNMFRLLFECEGTELSYANFQPHTRHYSDRRLSFVAESCPRGDKICATAVELVPLRDAAAPPSRSSRCGAPLSSEA